MSVIELIALLLVLTACFGWINQRFFHLPDTVGVLVMGLAASILLLLLELAVPEVTLYDDLTQVVQQIDFQQTVLEGMLAFLLFAGALHVDFVALRKREWVVGSMATLGVLISTGLIGTGLWALSNLLGQSIPFVVGHGVWCFDQPDRSSGRSRDAESHQSP
jgi:CPA1 family monovalent cation:H+ antiporter